MKKLSVFIVIILLLCGGALWFLASGQLNDFIKAQIETIGTQTTGQTVKVAAVDIKFDQGAGTIKGFSLANPDSYKAPHAFSFGDVTLDINLQDSTKELIILDAIVINNPQAFVEFTQNGGANIKDILDSIKENTPSSEGETAPKSKPSAKEPNISISKLVLAKTSLSVDLTAFGNKNHQMTLPDINLNNIGGAEGLPASQLGAEIGKQALSAIWKQSKKTQKEKIKDEAEKQLKDKALEKLGDLFGN